MNSNHGRKRGGSFHLADEENNERYDSNVQFVTPYYDERAFPEPLDLSKLCLDDGDDLFEAGNNEGHSGINVDENCTRGRSRSRSVHENDLGLGNYVPTNSDSFGSTSSESGSDNDDIGNLHLPRARDSHINVHVLKNNKNQDICVLNEKAERRGGPLQQREVQALKKV